MLKSLNSRFPQTITVFLISVTQLYLSIWAHKILNTGVHRKNSRVVKNTVVKHGRLLLFIVSIARRNDDLHKLQVNKVENKQKINIWVYERTKFKLKKKQITNFVVNVFFWYLCGKNYSKNYFLIVIKNPVSSINIVERSKVGSKSVNTVRCKLASS